LEVDFLARNRCLQPFRPPSLQTIGGREVNKAFLETMASSLILAALLRIP